jgi:hypothetical protein
MIRASKNMAGLSGNKIDSLGYGLHELLHDLAEIMLGHGQNHVKVIGHEDKRLKLDFVHCVNKKAFSSKC